LHTVCKEKRGKRENENARKARENMNRLWHFEFPLLEWIAGNFCLANSEVNENPRKNSTL
jgi:hypothetical protein